jgi:hypothetical protein
LILLVGTIPAQTLGLGLALALSFVRAVWVMAFFVLVHVVPTIGAGLGVRLLCALV